MFKALDGSRSSLCIFLDLAKAFDTVDHQQLLNKQERVGIRGIALKLLTSYLYGRRQIVRVQNEMSEPRNVTYGVPQGTVLGPILFTLYVNDILTLQISGKILSFADDTAIYYSSESCNQIKTDVERDLKKIKQLFDSKKLTINYDKTVYLPLAYQYNMLPTFNFLTFNNTNNEEIQIKVIVIV